MRPLKFRVFDKETNKYYKLVKLEWDPETGEVLTIIAVLYDGGYEISSIVRDIEDVIIEQFTGLLDTSLQHKYIYEGDIIDRHGQVKGRKQESPSLLETPTNFLIEGLGTKTWRNTEQKSIERGCFYAE